METEFLARLQFAFTIMFHYIYPPLSIGLGVALVIMEGIWLRTGNVLYHNMARFWTRVFALTFSIGVATGIVMEFEFGTNWATYSRFVGDIFGSALAAEGIFAFFLESGFLAVLLFGWNKVGPKMHFFATCMVCLGSHFSAVWIVVANSWMQTPAGYHLEKMGPNGANVRLPADYVLQPADLTTVRAVVDDFWAMVFNPSSIDRLTHTILGAWMAGAFLVLSISAFYLLRKRHTDFAVASLKVGLVFASVATILQMISGDSTAKGVVRNQPIKLAAIEGVYKTEPYTPLTLFGYVDPKTQTVHGPQIPGMLSFLCYMDFQKPVIGLNEQPSDTYLKARYPTATPEQLPEIRKRYWPIVPLVFQTYHLMIGIGGACLGLVLAGLFLWWKGWLFDTERKLTRWYLIALVFSVIGPQVANQAGWLTAELGRQPWIVYGLLKTSQGLSKVVTANQILFSLILFAMVYLLLFAVFIYLLTRKIQHGPETEEESEEMPESWRQLIVETEKAPRA
ncbi:MAG: cytochrome ubiquinol oxidase subunit I [Candidatus Methylacidiphilales bacterium]|nr:cytochrome ubiquinol oxidase subunit I [Candidatus Methylacidiphilales bacterium]